MASSSASRKLLLDRFDKFTSNEYFTDVNLKSKVYTQELNISHDSIWYYSVPAHLERPSPSRIIPNEAQLFTKTLAERGSAENFGPAWSTHWFKICISIPESFHQNSGKQVHFVWDSHSEALIFNEHCVPLQGLTGGDPSQNRYYYILRRDEGVDVVHGGEQIVLYVEMACNGLFGNGDQGFINPPDMNRTFSIHKCKIALFDTQAYKLMIDFKVIAEMAQHLPEDSNRGRKALQCASNIINAWHHDDPDTWQHAQQIATKFLKETNGSSQHNIIATGHCHLDIAWLWPYGESRRKAARSWASQCEYMDHNPNFIFAQSQAQLYDWVKQDYPKLFEKIKEKVKLGQFVPVGGSWVEMCGILPSGESMIRQFLYGQTFFKKEFGLYATEFWLPDSFGYSGQLPQIMKGAKIESFVTQKLSWNLFNTFPYQTFMWEGLDGTQVLTHFPPADSYSSSMNVEQILYNVKNHKSKEKSNYSLALFGHGDGGGGPTPEMLDRVEACADVDGLPKVQFGTAKHFFDKCREEEGEFEKWRGELYLEMHRGTYTSQASTKKENRKGELLLRDVEILSIMSGSIERDEYPSGELERLWKLLLLNQFHDVLPGSSINMVYQDALRYYSDIQLCGRKLKAISMLRILSYEEEAGSFTVFNTLGWKRKEVIELPSTVSHIQQSYDGKPLAIVEIDGIGYKKHSISPIVTEPQLSIRDTDDGIIIMQNQFISVNINKDSGTLSIYDKRANRYAVENGNKFCIYEDIPLFWDAWDLEFYYENKKPMTGKVVEVSIIETGPIRASVLLHIQFTESCFLKQRISLTCLSPRLEFHCQATWVNISHKILKVLFPTTVRASEASYEVQFGHLQRPTHRNTLWDQAKFEVHAHKWADISEYGYGVSLLNDCKYGYSTKDNVMTLSLLRAPKSPDNQCDMGDHEFSYAVIPHLGTLQESGIIQEAYNFNVPLITSPRIPSLDCAQEQYLVSTSSPNLVIESIKKAEDDNSIIVRLYEAYGGYVPQATLTTSLKINAVHLCNLLEENEKILSCDHEGTIAIGEVKPFQIISIKLITDLE